MKAEMEKTAEEGFMSRSLPASDCTAILRDMALWSKQ
jgi:hypothetical protein